MKLSGQKIDGRFLGSDHLLEHARLSFGYFEHFPINSIEKPFDLMARCLFRGSALTLHGTFPGIDIMIPLVLENGQISFLGVQVKYVNQQYMTNQIKKAVPKMTYSNIFGGQSTRPFAMIILALNEDSPVVVEKSSSEMRNPLDNPDVIIFKGISKAILTRGPSLFRTAPSGATYRGIDEKYLKESDFMHDLVREIDPQSIGKDISQQTELHRDKRRKTSSKSGKTNEKSIVAGPSSAIRTSPRRSKGKKHK